MSLTIAFYDSKPYDREYFTEYLTRNSSEPNTVVFHDFRLSTSTATSTAGAQVVCIFVNDHLDRACLEILSRGGVRLVALRCAGFNNVDTAAARELGIAVVRVPSYSPHAVAEHAVGLLMTLNRKIHRAYNRVREQNFSLNGLVGFDLAGKTVGVIGTGRIGRVAAQIFRGYDCHVIAHDVQPSEAWATPHGVRYVNRDELLRDSDIVTLHLPLSPETYHLVNDQTLACMKRGAYVINTSRGKLLDTAATIRALKSGHLGGVALDVYEEEEGVFFEDLSNVVLQDDELARLIGFPNVLVTAHQAFLTREALKAITLTTMENVNRFRDGESFIPECIVA